MDKFDELRKLVGLFSGCPCNRTSIGLTSDVAFTIHGKFESLFMDEYKLLLLDDSEISHDHLPTEDELFMFTQMWVINSANKSAKETRDILSKKLDEKFSNLGLYINVFVGGIDSRWTGFTGERRYVKFLLSDNDKYGHDILIIFK